MMALKQMNYELPGLTLTMKEWRVCCNYGKSQVSAMLFTFYT